MVERSAKKTKFEVERSTPEAFLLLEIAQVAEFKECKDGMSADVAKKRGMAGRSTGQKMMEEKEAKLSSRIGRKHAEAQSTNHNKE